MNKKIIILLLMLSSINKSFAARHLKQDITFMEKTWYKLRIDNLSQGAYIGLPEHLNDLVYSIRHPKLSWLFIPYPPEEKLNLRVLCDACAWDTHWFLCIAIRKLREKEKKENPWDEEV